MATKSAERIAEKLDFTKPSHMEIAARMVVNGEVIAFPFNGIFGLFGDIDDPTVAVKITNIKQRPLDKKHVITYLPEHIEEIVDVERVHISMGILKQLWKVDLHALGAILPASTNAPDHLILGEYPDASILSIYTEYPPIRNLSEHVRFLGGRGLVATSANKKGQPTHWRFEELFEDFKWDVSGIVYGDFSGLPEIRRKSTSILDFTNTIPRLHREGNVPEDELREALRKHGLPELYIGRDVITVRSR